MKKKNGRQVFADINCMKFKVVFVLIFISLTSALFSEVFKSNVEASYYADKYHGRKTASGEIFNMYDMTCAHKTLPFGTVLRITNLKNNKIVDVRVNDRGPFVKNREIDVSKAAAQKLGMIGSGTARVKIEILNSALAKTTATSQQNSKSSVKAAYWDVQVGSFSSHENANNLAQNLLKKGFENVYFQKTSTVTRVVIKKIPNSKLELTESKLRENGYKDFIVKKNS